eukprot:951011_1
MSTDSKIVLKQWNVKNRNHGKRKQALNYSVDDEESTDMESNHSDDDIAIGRKRKKKRKRNEKEEPNKKKRKYNANDCNFSQLYTSTKRNKNKNIPARQQNDEDRADRQEPQRQDMAKPFFAQIFGDENTSVAATQLTMRYDGMASQLDQMKQENMKRAKKEIARDIASHLVSKYKAQMDQNTIVPSGGVTCFKCNSDPNDMEWELLLCEYCSTGAAHCSCVDPMYCSVPEGAWACNSCQHEVISKHQDEYNRIVMAKHQELEKQCKRTWRSQSLLQQRNRREEMRPKSFTSQPQPLFPGFFGIPSITPGYPPPPPHGLSMLNPMDSRMINHEAVPPLPPSVIFNAPIPAPAPAPAAPQQMFDQFLHALNQKNATHPQAVAPSTNTININRLSVTNISCSNFTGGIPAIPPNQQSNNQCMSQSQPCASLQTNDDNMINEQTFMAMASSNILDHVNKINKTQSESLEWPIESTKIVLQPIGPQRRKKRFAIVGCYPNNIYSDYYYSPSLSHQRNSQ